MRECLEEEEEIVGLEVMFRRSPFPLLYPVQIASIYQFKFKSFQFTSPATAHRAPLPASGGGRFHDIYLCVRALLYSSFGGRTPGPLRRQTGACCVCLCVYPLAQDERASLRPAVP